MLHGFLYGLINDSFPGVVKVGQTTRTTSIRVNELSSATGVPTPFRIAFEFPCAHVRHAESVIHRILEDQGCRVSPNREFFRCSSDQIVRIIEDYALCELPEGGFSNDLSPSALLALGDKLLAETPTKEACCNALTYYRQALKRGSLQAHEHSARACLLLDQGDSDYELVISHLKAGCEAGNYYCYAMMALVLAETGDRASMVQAWQRFFSSRAEHPLQSIEDEGPSDVALATIPAQVGLENAGCNIRFMRACRQYIGSCLTMGIEPQHLDQLRPNVTSILTLQQNDLANGLADTNSNALILMAIEWTYLNLACHQPSAASETSSIGSLPAPSRRRQKRSHA